MMVNTVCNLVYDHPNDIPIAIGWTKTVDTDSHSNWLKRFFSYIETKFPKDNGLHILGPDISKWESAIHKANSYTYFPFSGTTSVRIATSLLRTVNNDFKKNNSELYSRIIFSNIEKEVPLSTQSSEIFDFMKEHVKDFNEIDYEISIESTESEDATILLYHKSGEVYTNAGYNIIRKQVSWLPFMTTINHWRILAFAN